MKRSMSDQRPEREWRFYIDDMLSFAEKILAYTEGLDQETFVSSDLTYDATLRNLALIGEAATRIPEDVRADHAEVPWRLIIATRNRLIHAYLGVDNDTIWSIIQENIPELLVMLEHIQAQHRDPPSSWNSDTSI
ncbi:HepT-like ribonuclease domain-containing protein [Salinicola halophyticus]|uniref:HepT-like ribonuclease domain-containing protein n=1 Tax=Salinicola halophyticus TaxID=1808881 RepID=UPI003F48D0C9